MVTLRGQEYDVTYIDFGYEPDTGAQEIDWWFVEPPDFELTDVEEQRVYDVCASASDYGDEE